MDPRCLRGPDSGCPLPHLAGRAREPARGAAADKLNRKPLETRRFSPTVIYFHLAPASTVILGPARATVTFLLLRSGRPQRYPPGDGLQVRLWSHEASSSALR